MPTLVPSGSKSPHVELRPSEETVKTSSEDGPGSNDEEQGLLLPSHVMLDTVAAVDEADEEDGPVGDTSMEGLHFVDDDVAKGVTRYFDDSAGGIDETSFLATADQSKICSNCKKPGHKPRDCPHIICTTCGVMDQHERRDCPFGLSCPSLWRVYTYFSTESRAEAIRAKSVLTSWEKEAACGGASEQWCYNCARQGHLGDDCPSRRGSLARLMTPSAFSEQMSSRGPFRGKIGSGKDKLVEGVASHMRFDEDVDLEGTIREWGGLGAGRKSREKEQRKMVERERRAAGSGDGAGQPGEHAHELQHEHQGGSGGRKRRRKEADESGTDWEANWRAEGKLGGNVAAWGSEMDQEERKAKKSFEREKGGGTGKGRDKGGAGPVPVTAQGTQQKGNKGQRYHGGISWAL
ncbi:hypothetical protein EHS25_003342 [Saitozyma podzolica]|uniref:CCHC-type domain-containing protein n=1 Tax=Saitozyma podzolica TaxID=1890683 RepID=A0A427Y8I1_9TREE|nr:hypothetical protein EHS25_003342 [Saitozyma podzolica]